MMPYKEIAAQLIEKEALPVALQWTGCETQMGDCHLSIYL